jgi:hypothetical protein
MPHPPEPAVVSLVKKIPVVGSTRRATYVLYALSALLLILSFLMVYSFVSVDDRKDFKIPASLNGKI